MHSRYDTKSTLITSYNFQLFCGNANDELYGAPVTRNIRCPTPPSPSATQLASSSAPSELGEAHRARCSTCSPKLAPIVGQRYPVRSFVCLRPQYIKYVFPPLRRGWHPSSLNANQFSHPSALATGTSSTLLKLFAEVGALRRPTISYSLPSLPFPQARRARSGPYHHGSHPRQPVRRRAG